MVSHIWNPVSYPGHETLVDIPWLCATDNHKLFYHSSIPLTPWVISLCASWKLGHHSESSGQLFAGNNYLK